jgi:hypothetical protein
MLFESAERTCVIRSIKPITVPTPKFVEIGTRHYNVEFIASQMHGTGAPLAGLAVDVAPSEDTLSAFRDYCLDLFKAYGWTSVAVAERSMTLQKRDETIRVFPVIDCKALRAAMSAHPIGGSDV